MKVSDRLRTWWQLHTGEEETPFDGDTPAWVLSMGFHFVLLMVVTFMPSFLVPEPDHVLIASLPVEEVEEIKLPEEFYFNEQPSQEIGANSQGGVTMAEALAQVVDEVSDVPNPMDDVQPTEVATIEINNTIEVATGPKFDQNLRVKGFVGQGATGAVGAVDRITHEILLSLEERKTLVVWLFDQTESLIPQRQAIHDRFDRIYEELGLIEAAGNEAFKKHEDAPLLTSIVGFGSSVNLLTKKPTSDLEEIKKVVADIPLDDKGDEKVFEAIYKAVNEYKSFRYVDENKPQPERNVLIIAFTDEAGSDQNGLEQTIHECRRYAMPVYVVGVPAPFGRDETSMKWIDPNPNFDQSPQWGKVTQGPESYLPERIKLEFANWSDKDDPIDSGFGPYSLTRLCYETGGIYFSVHPNRNVNREVSRGETAAFSAHISQFFDPQIMRKYRPDYVAPDEYMRRMRENKSREALVKAASLSWLNQMAAPQTRFAKTDEATFVNALSEAQKAAAKLEPEVNVLYETLKLGEPDRAKENVPRWQAGYDLAMGRVMAVKARTEAYNAMLAAAKRGLKFKDEKNNTWVLAPADEISVGSQLEKLGARAREYLQRVVTEHPSTPWAFLAQKELENPVGWKWDESYTPPPAPAMDGAGNANSPANDALKMLDRKPKRNVPKLIRSWSSRFSVFAFDRKTESNTLKRELQRERAMLAAVRSHNWDLDAAAAMAVQRELAAEVETADRLPGALWLVAGVDVAYDTESDRVFAAAVVLDVATLRVVETATASLEVRFPYVPGLFSFRELPPLALALEKLQHVPQLVVCDGHGLAHPRRFGLACHLGVLYDLPTIGCGKTRLVGESVEPGARRGDSADLIDGGETIGRVLRTQDGVKPVFVSVGHRISLDTACDWVLRLAPRYRLPETTRAANGLVNELRRQVVRYFE